MSFTATHVVPLARVLIYIEHRPTAERLTSLLAENEVETAIAHNEWDFHQIAASPFDAVVTSTRMIAKVCLQSQLPIVNVERFVFSVLEHDALKQGSKRFDGQKFVAEIFEAKHPYRLERDIVQEGRASQHGAAL